MPVQIDEISAEIEPSRPELAPPPPHSAPETSPATALRRERELLARLEVRAARVFAD